MCFVRWYSKEFLHAVRLRVSLLIAVVFGRYSRSIPISQISVVSENIVSGVTHPTYIYYTDCSLAVSPQ